jgi:iron complex outermembrane receptor protein
VGYDAVRGDETGTELDLSRPFGPHHIVTAGSEFRYNPIQRQQYHVIGSPTMILDDRRRSNVSAVFAEDEVKIGSQLLLNVGIRLDHYSTFGNATSPRLAAVYHAGTMTQLKYVYGTAFRAPSAYEAYSTDGISQTANPALGPEKIANHNVSVARSLASGFTLIAEAFHSQRDNLINLRLDAVGTMGQFQNVGSDRTNGLEFGVDKQHRGLQVHLAYTLQKSMDRDTNQEAANSPRHLAKARIQVPLRSSTMVGMEGLYISDQKNYLGQKVPGALTTNLSLTSRKPIFGFDVSADCYNVLDRRNFDPVSTDLVQSRLEQEGREFRVKISRFLRRR